MLYLQGMAEEYVELQELDEAPAEEGFEHPYQGEILMSWMIDEYRPHQRGPLWYGVAVTLGFGLLIYSIITQNFLFAVMVLMFGLLIGLTAIRKPGRVPFVITDLGMGVGDHFTPYKEIKNYWMIYEPPEVKTLYIEFRNAVLPHLIVPIDDQNPLDIRETMGRFVPEDLGKEDEPFMDWIARQLKI